MQQNHAKLHSSAPHGVCGDRPSHAGRASGRASGSEANADRDVVIRAASAADLQAMRALYSTYVETSAVTFEYEVPTAEDFAARFESLWDVYPVLVASTATGMLLGYAYAHPFYGYAAYDWGAELTIYVDKSARRTGVGSCLYDVLEQALRTMGLVSLYACITTCDRGDDPFVTQASVAFHESRGWRLVGRFNECGFKFSRWYDVVWMEKALAVRQDGAAPVRKKFSELMRLPGPTTL